MYNSIWVGSLNVMYQSGFSNHVQVARTRLIH